MYSPTQPLSLHTLFSSLEISFYKKCTHQLNHFITSQSLFFSVILFNKKCTHRLNHFHFTLFFILWKFISIRNVLTSSTIITSLLSHTCLLFWKVEFQHYLQAQPLSQLALCVLLFWKFQFLQLLFSRCLLNQNLFALFSLSDSENLIIFKHL